MSSDFYDWSFSAEQHYLFDNLPLWQQGQINGFIEEVVRRRPDRARIPMPKITIHQISDPDEPAIIKNYRKRCKVVFEWGYSASGSRAKNITVALSFYSDGQMMVDIRFYDTIDASGKSGVSVVPFIGIEEFFFQLAKYGLIPGVLIQE